MSDFDSLITLGGFFAALYVGGELVSKLRLSRLLGEIGVGVVLGPEVVGLLTPTQESALQLVGNVGVTFMIFESGMHINYEKLKVVVWRSLFVSLLSVGLPVGSGVLFAYAVYGGGMNEGSIPDFNATEVSCEGSSCYEDVGQSVFPDGVSLGFALIPTSVAVVSKILTETKALGSFLGQTIKISTAFVEDIFAVGALVILVNVAKNDLTPLNIILPLIYAATFVTIGGAIGFVLYPIAFHKIEGFVNLSSERLRQLQVFLMVGVLALYGYIGSLIGTHLLGAFVAGMSFSRVPRSHQIWVNQNKKISKWLIRIFFGSTVAFSIPISEMIKVRAFGLGIACAVGPCILSKIISGIAMERGSRFVTGAGMIPRAEFAFLIAEAAKSTDYEAGRQPYGKMMSSEMYSVTVWALLFATVLGPPIFTFALHRHAEAKAKRLAAEGKDSVFAFKLKVKGRYVPFIVHDVVASLKELNLNADNVRLESDEHTFILSTIVRTATMKLQDVLDDETFETVRHHLLEAINDEEGIIVMTPVVQKRAVQLGCLHFYDGNGDEISLRNARASNIGGDCPSGSQMPEGVLSHDANVRWADRNQLPLVIQFAEPVVIKAYTFTTAKDFANNAIEPTSWCLEGIPASSFYDNNGEWKVLDTVENFNTPTARNQQLPRFSIEEGIFHSIRFSPMELHGTGCVQLLPDEPEMGQRTFKPGVHHMNDESGQTHFVVIKVMGEHNTRFIVTIYQIIAMLKLDIHKVKMYQTQPVACSVPLNIKVLYCKDLTTFGGLPTKERLTDIREKLADQLRIHGISGKAMVNTIRLENAPRIYGFTPSLPDGTRVGEFVFVYKHPRIKRNREVWCPLTAVLEWMHTEMHFDIINLAMDTDTKTRADHVTVFVRDPSFGTQHDEETIVKELASIFEAKEVACFVSAHLHKAGDGRMVMELGEEKTFSPNGTKPAFTPLSEARRGFSWRCYHGESLGMMDINSPKVNFDSPYSGIRRMGTFRAHDPIDFKAALDNFRRQISDHIDEAENRLMELHAERVKRHVGVR